MRSRKVLVSPAAVLLALSVFALTSTGCGGSSNKVPTASTGATLPPGVKPETPLPPVKDATLTANLAGYPEGSPAGSAAAVLSIHGSTLELCWMISQLVGVPNPTELRLFRNFKEASGRNGLKLGSHYTSSGCDHQAAASLALIAAKPEKFDLSIHSAKYPHGAIRGPLQP